MRIWDVDAGKTLATKMCNRESSQALCFSPDGNTLAVGGYDGRVVFFDCLDWEQRFELPAKKSAIANLAFSADGNVLVIATADGNVDFVGPGRNAFRSLWQEAKR